jgi:sialate O-acetylesterase
MNKALAIIVCVWGLTLEGLADVQMSRMFNKGMVLQRDLPAPIYGWADPGEKITVSLAGQAKSTTAGDDGRWQVVLDPLATSSKGQTLTIRGNNTKAFKDVLVGEVWLCAGQSNMAGSFGDRSPMDPKYLEMDLKHLIAPSAFGCRFL